MQRRDVVYLVCALAVVLLLGYKLWHVRARWRSPRVWAVWATVFFVGAAVWLAAPANRWWLHRATGVPNIGSPLYCGCASASAASFLALALLWRYPARAAWPRVRRVLTGYALVIAAIAALFAASSVPVERPVDFGTYYARQPTVAALMMLWLMSIMAGFAVLASWCFAWAGGEDYAELPWLRRGLRLYGSVGLTITVLVLAGIVSVAATWFGTRALDPLAVVAPVVLVPLSTVLLVAALVVPVVGPRWPAARTWAGRWWVVLLLWSLHRRLRQVSPDAVLVAPGKRLDPYHRARRMVIELNDLRWELVTLFDPAVGEAASRLGRQAGLAGEERAIVVEAAQLKSASRAWRHGLRGAEGASAGLTDGDEEARDGTDVEAELRWWVLVARAVRTSPVVAEALKEARTPAARRRA